MTVADRDEARLRVAFLVLVAICGVGYGIFLVHSAHHRSACAHYRALLTAALADPFSTAPVVVTPGPQAFYKPFFSLTFLYACSTASVRRFS